MNTDVLFILTALLVFLVLFCLLVSKQIGRYKKYAARVVEHMNTLERKTDRMIELLEEIRKK